MIEKPHPLKPLKCNEDLFQGCGVKPQPGDYQFLIPFLISSRLSEMFCPNGSSEVLTFIPVIRLSTPLFITISPKFPPTMVQYLAFVAKVTAADVNVAFEKLLPSI